MLNIEFFPQMEQLKRRSYEGRVREVEHGNLTPLIFAVTGVLDD